VEKLRAGLWRWTAPHPDWTPSSDWEREVSSLAYAGEGGLVLIDPLVPGGDWSALDSLSARAGGVVTVAVTVPYHERDAGAAAARYGAELFAPKASGPRRESLAAGHPIADGDSLPGGIEAILVEQAEEALLYLTAARTLVGGDVLQARDGRLSLCPASWLDDESQLEEVRAVVARALQKPLEAVVVLHGEPPLFEGRAELELALRE
jgi:glyoxylase-like metal-dependent hydrolase (beta-lactamase superfamily II)